MPVPCVLFEDDHLLAVNKPPGINTHAPAAHSGDGLYEWLKNRERRWASIAIVHRLDRDTSGIILFTKTPLANRSLTEQFSERKIVKEYLLLSAQRPSKPWIQARSKLARAGERYVSSNLAGAHAETRFEFLRDSSRGALIKAQPVTGRTHQIRVHAAENGFPVLGDSLYGGSPHPRVCLHAARIELRHPATGEPIAFATKPDFETPAGRQLRRALIDPGETTSFRLIHGAADQHPGWYVDQLGGFLLSQSEDPLPPERRRLLESIAVELRLDGVYHKRLDRRVRQSAPEQASPQLLFGRPAPDRFEIIENSLRFQLSFNEGYSVGLFLDQRDNRRRLTTGYIAPGFELFGEHENAHGFDVLNTFAYTCAFSVAAARAAARATSLDLSKKYLDWGRANLLQNDIDPVAHDFIYGDVFDWLRRFERKERRFHLVVLDPPTFSSSKKSGVFRVEKDLGRLVSQALRLLHPRGCLLGSTNSLTMSPGTFIDAIDLAVQSTGRRIAHRHFQSQPPDFPVARDEPAHLKTEWLQFE